jgi:hypothetical protein
VEKEFGEEETITSLSNLIDAGDVLRDGDVVRLGEKLRREWIPPKLQRERAQRQASFGMVGWISWSRRVGEPHGVAHATIGERRALCGVKIPQNAPSITLNSGADRFCEVCVRERTRRRLGSRVPPPRPAPPPSMGAGVGIDLQLKRSQDG